MRSKIKLKHWIIFLALAIGVHLMVLLSLRESFLSIFKKSINTEPATAPGKSFSPDFIITLPVILEESKEEKRTEEKSINNQANKTLDKEPEKSQLKQHQDLGESGWDLQSPITSSPNSDNLSIPPRPLEISWPDTRGLDHCIGRIIEFRILVDSDGEILNVKPIDSKGSDECLESAIEAARKIIFAPGRIQGKPVQMWTEIRIEFKPQEQK